jgi:Domain of unknown function (DUF4034)
MFQQPFGKPFGIAGPFGLLALALSTSSCAQSEASRPAHPPDAVMRAIRDYGRGHQALLSPGSDEKPAETGEAYSDRIKKLTSQEKFAELEKMARQNRTEKGRVLGGGWKMYEFYDGAATPEAEGEPQLADYARRVATLKKWIAAYPESAAPRLSLARLYIEHAWKIRGTDYANTVSDAQWSQFEDGNAQGEAILLEAASLKDRDPMWYALMQSVALSDGWDKPRARELFEQAAAFEPGFYNFYRNYAVYLLPQWYGEPGELQAFAEETAKRVPEPDGSIFYFDVLSALAYNYPASIAGLLRTSYPKLREGYQNNTRLYGTSNLTANRFAFMASIFKDKSAAHEAFATLTRRETQIWGGDPTFDVLRDWANTP